MRVLLPVTIFAIAAIAPVAVVLAQVPSAGNAKHGGQLFVQCRACHALGAGATAIGPDLVGVVGRKAASIPGYAYSAALSYSGLTWTPDALDKFIERPNAAVPGTRMGFGGIANPQARADIIAYLATFKTK